MISCSTKRIGHSRTSDTPPSEKGMAVLFRRAWVEAATVAFWIWESTVAIAFARFLGKDKRSNGTPPMTRGQHEKRFRK